MGRRRWRILGRDAEPLFSEGGEHLSSRGDDLVFSRVISWLKWALVTKVCDGSE